MSMSLGIYRVEMSKYIKCTLKTKKKNNKTENIIQKEQNKKRNKQLTITLMTKGFQ